MGTILFRSLFFFLFLKPLLPLEGDQCFKKILFLLDETVFFNFFRHWFTWKQYFGPLKSCFLTNPLFGLVEMVPVNYKPFGFIQSFLFHHSCRPFFKGEYYSFLLKLFPWVLAGIPASGSSFFRLVETKISSNPLSRLVYPDFGLISNRVLYSEIFFPATGKHYWNPVYTSFLQIFQFLTKEAVFPASKNGFSMECYSFQRVETDFLSSVLLFSANFVLVKTLIQIKVKPFLIEQPLSNYWKLFSTRFFIYIPAGESNFSAWKRMF